MNLQHVFAQSDAIGKAVAILLLLMSIASWVVILWKAWLLRRAGGDVVRSVAAFWQAPSLDDAASRVGGFDRGQMVLPLGQATQLTAGGTPAAGGERPAPRGTPGAGRPDDPSRRRAPVGGRPRAAFHRVSPFGCPRTAGHRS